MSIRPCRRMDDPLEIVVANGKGGGGRTRFANTGKRSGVRESIPHPTETGRAESIIVMSYGRGNGAAAGNAGHRDYRARSGPAPQGVAANVQRRACSGVPDPNQGRS